MRKKFNAQKESFSVFSASLVAGDTAIFSKISAVDHWMGAVSELLRRGVVVRTPDRVALDAALRSDTDVVGQVARLGAAMDRKTTIRSLSVALKERALQSKKQKHILETKVHQLIEEQGLGVVEACRKVHCRPSDYYIYRGKLKTKSYGR